MEYKIGMIVDHPAMPEWGSGKIVAIRGDYIYVIFRNLPEREAKKFNSSKIALIIASDQNDPILNNLSPVKEKDGTYLLPRRRLTVVDAIETFTRKYHQGFSDPAYLRDERNYKVEAHQLWENNLGDGKAKKLLELDKIEELVNHTKEVLNGLNLLSRFENMALRDGLSDRKSAKNYFEALINLLESAETTEENFLSYANAVSELPQEEGKSRVNTWPIATLLPYIAQPDRHMFLKPEVTQSAAETFGFDLHYDPKPNWNTYNALLAMSKIYREQIFHLGPRDNIDMQSFIWVVAQP